MENVNPFGPPIPPNVPHDQIVQELDKLFEISAMIDSCLKNIDHNLFIITPPVSPEQLLNDFMYPPDFLEIDDLESDVEFEDTPLVPLFLNSDEQSDAGEVMNDMNEYVNTMFKNLSYIQWSKIPLLLILSDGDKINGLKYSYEKNKLVYKDSLNLGPEYQVDEGMEDWLIRRHVSMHEMD
ncbi:hypothetical protein Tco_1214488 [Tanacetum coccineum]